MLRRAALLVSAVCVTVFAAGMRPISANTCTITGTSGDDVLVAGAGCDNAVMRGLGGDDSITGTAGNDAIDGGYGADTLHGVGGRNTFVYCTEGESQLATGVDLITDFVETVGNQPNDQIDVSGICGTLNVTCSWVGGAGFDGTKGEFELLAGGGNTYVRADMNGDKQPDMNIELSGIHSLKAGNMVFTGWNTMCPPPQ